MRGPIHQDLSLLLMKKLMSHDSILPVIFASNEVRYSIIVSVFWQVRISTSANEIIPLGVVFNASKGIGIKRKLDCGTIYDTLLNWRRYVWLPDSRRGMNGRNGSSYREKNKAAAPFS